MTLFDGMIDFARWRGCVAAVGNFDGVHRGHQAMIEELRRRADAASAPAVAITFDPPPVELLRPEAAPPRLMRLQERVEYLEAHGADAVLVLPTDRQLLDMSAESFFEEVLVGQLGVRGLVEGPNFRFGRGRRGDVNLLRTLCADSGVGFDVVEPVRAAGEVVSSSLIRLRVSTGDLRAAAPMLGRPHEAVGLVERGAGRGRGLGFPTANLNGISTLLPPDGVYAGRARVGGAEYPAAIHIGANSTFGESARTFEAHLLGFSDDLYARSLRIELLEKVRDTRRFDSPEALVAQLQADCRRVGELVVTGPGPG